MAIVTGEARTQFSNLMMAITLTHHTIFKHVSVLSCKQYRNDMFISVCMGMYC